MVDVKICGLSTLESVDAAINAGADLVGLVFYPRSPRNVSVQQAKTLADHARGRARIVADRKSTRLNSSHIQKSRMPSSA